MADLKISELPDGGQPQDNDELPQARLSSNFKLTWANIRAWMEARFAPLAHVSDTDNPHSVTAAQVGAVEQDGAGADNSFAYWSTYATRHLAAVTATDKGAPPYAMIYRDGLNAWKERNSEQLAFDAGYLLNYAGFNQQYIREAQMFYGVGGAGFYIDGGASASLSLQDRSASAAAKAGRLRVAAGTLSLDSVTDWTYTLPVDGAGGGLVGGTQQASHLTVDLASGDVDVKTGNLLEQGQRVHSDANPGTFALLTDTPNDYTGQAGRFAAVNGTETALEFVDGGTGGATTFLQLDDTPVSYTAQSGKLVAVNGAADALEFIDPPAGAGDVTSALPTVDGEVQVGDATSKGIKGAGFQGSAVYHTGNPPFYQTIQSQQVGQAQRSTLDFDGGLVAFDVGGATRAVLSLTSVTRQAPQGDPETALWVYNDTGFGTRSRTTPEMRADFGFLSDRHTATIGTIGYPFTPTPEGSGTITPDPAANLAYYSTFTGTVTVDLSSFTVDGQCAISFPSSVTAVNLTGTEGDTVDPGTGQRLLSLMRVNGIIYHSWSPSG